MSILEKLTEGIVSRDLTKDGHALIDKWEKTGLLEGLDNDTKRNNMAVLLENQAKELLRETSSLAVGGDVEGFAAVAFPIVRRVFAGLIANDLVSVQPMSLPSGLIFFLDFTYGSTKLAGVNVLGQSLYGGGKVGAQITGGVNLDGANISKSFYDLNNGYSSPTGSGNATIAAIVSGTMGGSTSADLEVMRLAQYDPDIASGTAVFVGNVAISSFTQLNRDDLITVDFTALDGRQARRLTQLESASADGGPTNLLIVIQATGSMTADDLNNLNTGSEAAQWVMSDDWTTGGAVGSVIADPIWGLENTTDIAEIDIKVDSISVTAMTKKLKAKWTPELGQDLNAYHNLDAEVELTGILSEQIALEIDREILEDLVRGATAGTRFWSRAAGRFLNRETGGEIGASTVTPDFTGNVSEWYETLIETINDVSAQIHRKTLRGAANFCVVGPEVANILEFTAGFRANVTADSDRGDAGAVKVGSLSKKFDIMVDPYFVRNLILVGRRGSSFLESGYVYAPYVPLQTTPTIFGVEDFVPRKGVMTRYAKKMVRPDMYGLVVVRDLV